MFIKGFVVRSRHLLANYFSGMPSSGLAFWVCVGGMVLGAGAGVLAGANPRYLALAIVSATVLTYFFAEFEQATVGLLIVRTSLDVFSEQQIPAAFALGLDALTLLYVTVLLLTRRVVYTDSFWWFFAGWVIVQGLWIVFSVQGVLGLYPSQEVLAVSYREWTRLFSWLMVYLLIMQLKNRFHPEKIVSLLLISLFIPVIAALMQKLLPYSLLPSLLATKHVIEEGRIEGTFGHPNGLATYLLFFMGLTYWKLNQAKRRWLWVLLLVILAFVFVGTKALFSLAMLSVFVVVLVLPKLKLTNAISGLLVLVFIVSLFASSEFGRARLGQLAGTPLFNPRVDVSRAVLLSNWDYNSFNWRIAQWTFLLQSWEKSPILGHGLATSIYLSPFKLYAHNDYIRALVEQGIVGLVTFLVFLGAQSVRLIQLMLNAPRGSAQQELCSVLFAFFMSTLLAMCTENLWSHTTLYFYWWTMFAITGWNWNKLPPSNSPVPISPISLTRL